MRRNGIPVTLALAAVAFAGPVTPAAARTPLSVAVSCNNNGVYTYVCSAYPTGGTGIYSSYSWTVSILPPLSTQPNTYHSVTNDPYLDGGGCTYRDRITATVTVTDSGGATATSTGPTITCRYWPD